LTKLILRNEQGISVLFLIIAMLLMVTITYVLSYLIPTKHKWSLRSAMPRIKAGGGQPMAGCMISIV